MAGKLQQLNLHTRKIDFGGGWEQERIAQRCSVLSLSEQLQNFPVQDLEPPGTTLTPLWAGDCWPPEVQPYTTVFPKSQASSLPSLVVWCHLVLNGSARAGLRLPGDGTGPGAVACGLGSWSHGPAGQGGWGNAPGRKESSVILNSFLKRLCSWGEAGDVRWNSPRQTAEGINEPLNRLPSYTACQKSSHSANLFALANLRACPGLGRQVGGSPAHHTFSPGNEWGQQLSGCWYNCCWHVRKVIKYSNHEQKGFKYVFRKLHVVFVPIH